jgi:tetratricopeptide (TPR) repeat protein
MMRYALGAQAFQRKEYQSSLDLFESALKPPVSLGVDDFQFQASPRQAYYAGRVLEALGKNNEARAAYERSVAQAKQLSGDRDSWNSENYFMLLSLEKLGRATEAADLERHFENFAQSELDDKSAERRAEARYLLGLIRKRQGRAAEARQLMTGALDAQPDLLAARLELRGDVLDLLPAPAAR